MMYFLVVYKKRPPKKLSREAENQPEGWQEARVN
jgi:hypothetical protein